MPAVPFFLAGAALSGAAAAIGTTIAATITTAAISTAAATAIGIGTLSAVATAIQGGSVSDVLKSAVVGGLTSYVGGTIAADIGTSIAQDAFFNAIDAGFAGSAAIAASNFAGSAVTGAITSSFNALLNERDPIEALIKGGLTAGVSSAVSSAVDEFIKDIPGLKEVRGTVAGSAVERALKTSITNQILTNKSFDESFIESLTSSGISYLFNAAQSTLKDFTKDLLKDSDLVKRSEEQVDGLINREKDLVTTINSFVPTVEESYRAVQDNANTQNYWAQEANNLVPELQNLASKANKLKTIVDDINGPGGPVYYDSIGESTGWYVKNRYGQTIGDYYFTYTPDARYPHQEKYWAATVVNINTGERFVGSNWLNGLVNDINKNAEYINNTYPPLQERYDNAINNLNAAKGSYDEVLNNYNTQLNTLNGYKSELETTRLDYNKKLDEFNTNYKTYQTTLNNFISAEAENAGKIENLLNDAAQVMSSYEADYGVKPTDQQLADLFTSGNGDITKGYVSFDANNVSEKEAEAFLGELGYNPSDSEIKQFAGQINEDAARANIAGYVAPRIQKISDVFDYLNQGKLSPEQAQDELLRFGFKTEQIPAIFAANADAVDRSRKAQDIVNDYADIGSDLSREAAVQRLVQEAGVTETAANNYLSRVDAQVTARNDYANIARDFVANNLGTSEQAITRLRTSLANVGVTGDQQDEVVDAYNKMRLQAAGAEMTPSEMTNLAVLAAKKTGWVAIPGTSGHEVAFELTEEGDPRVVAARDKNGNNLLNQYQNLTPQGVMQVVNAQLAQSRAAEQTKGAPNQYAVDKELSDAASAAGLVRTTGMIRNNFSTVNTDYFNNLLRQYSAMSPEDRAKIASASGVTTDLRVLKDIDAQYKAIDQQYAAAVANNSPAANFYKSLDTRVENKAGYYYTNNGVQPSTAMAMAVQDLQGGNLFNRVNLSEVQDSKFPFETKEFINQFRGTPAGDTLANVLSSAYAVAGSAAANTLNGALGINLHIAEAMGMDTFANDFRKLATGIKTAGDDAIAIANASTDAHKNLIGGLSNVVSAIPWLATGVAPGIVAGAMATTYGNEYIQGRLAGQSIDDAGKRATLMAIAEGIGERIGADEAVRLLKPLWRTTPTDQLGKVIGDSLVNQIGKYGTKEQLGELLSYSLQAGVDKAPQIGLAQDMTGMEFIKGALDTIQQTFVAAGANSGLAVGLRGNMTQDNSGAIKVISPDGSQGLVELDNGSVIRVDIPEGLDLKVGEDININALMHDAVYVPDNVNERFNTLESQIKDIYQTELGRPPTFAELDFNVRRLADGTDILAVANELNNSQAGQLLDQRNTFNAQTDQQIAANAKSLLDQGRTTYAEFKDFMNTMGLASDRQLNVLDTITPRANVAGTVTSIIGDNAVVTGTDGQMYTMLRVAPNNYLIQVGDQVNLGVSTVKPDATPTVEVTTKIADVIAASVSKSTSISLSQSVSEAAVSTSISKSQSLSVSYSQSQSLSASTSVSVSESQSKSISLSQSVSTVELEKSISLSKSVSTSLSTSASLSTSTSLSQSVSASTSTSQSLSASISKAVSISEALSLSASVSEQMEKDRLKGLSISASLSESISQAVSVSESISKAVSISESTSASISTSQSISQATSISQSLSASTSQSESVSKATSISASVSASTSASLSASTSQSISLSQEVSKQVSISQSTSQSISLSQSLSQSQAVSISTSVSESVVKSASASLSLSQSTSAALSTSVSQSLSLSQKMSEDIVAGLSISASLSASQSVSQSISALISESISKAQSVTQTQSPAATQTVTQSITQSVTQSITQAITQSLTESLTLSITESITQPITLAPTIMPSVTLAPSISVTETFTQTPSLTMVITTTSLPPVTTTITIPPVTTTEPVTTEQVTTVTIPPVTPPPTSGTIPPVTTPSISVPDQTTTAPITTLPVTTAPITTAVTTARPPTTTARPLTTTARPGGLPFPIFGIPAATGQQTTYIDYAQPKVPAPEFGPYDLFKAPSYLRPLQDSGNFGLAALIGAASESQQRNGNNQSQQNAESQGQAPTG